MFWLKHCPKCGGDLFESADIHGDYISCLQCSHYLILAEEIALRFLSSKELNMAYRRAFGNQSENAEDVDRDAVFVCRCLATVFRPASELATTTIAPVVDTAAADQPSNSGLVQVTLGDGPVGVACVA